MVDREVIAAFVDGERVDADALKDALSSPEGRDYLAEIIALGELVGDEVPVALPASPSVSARRRGFRWVAAAAIVLSLAGGYVMGQQFPSTRQASKPEERAPQPTRVMELSWQESGGRQ